MSVQDYSTTPGNNTTISGINIAEGCPPSGINDAIRQMMADVRADSNAQSTRITTAQNKANTAFSNAATAQAAANTATFPGCVVMFSGTFGGSDGKRPIPAGGSAALEGWALCDGTNGTPDLRGRFIVGAGNTYTAGDKGGAATHAHTTGANATGYTTLDGNTLPSHNHPGYWRTIYSGGGGNGGLTVEGEPGNQWRDPVTHNRGSSWGHGHSIPAMNTTAASSLPPYYALAFIMKLPAAA